MPCDTTTVFKNAIYCTEKITKKQKCSEGLRKKIHQFIQFQYMQWFPS